MASVAGNTARSIFRSSSACRTAFRISSEAKAARSPFRIASNKPTSQSAFRSPVELSFCVESMLPFHSITASALMTSKLVVSQRSYGWLPEGIVSDTTTMQLSCVTKRFSFVFFCHFKGFCFSGIVSFCEGFCLQNICIIQKDLEIKDLD